MLRLSQVDLDDIAQALSDQTDYEHRWLLDPATGELHIWTSDTGLDGQDVVDGDELEETDLVAIDPLPSYVWYRDMADFAERVSDNQAVAMTGSGSAADPFMVDGLSIEIAGGAAVGDRFQIRPTRSGNSDMDLLIADPREIAAAAPAAAAAPGDNSNALLLAGLQSGQTM